MGIAVFKGIEFNVDSVGFSGGRKVQTNEAAFANTTPNNETGKKTGTFPVKGWISGPDYIEKTKKLIKVCHETESPGILIHPVYGTVKVICTSISQETAVGRFQTSTFSLTFQQSDDASITVIDNKADNVLEAAQKLKVKVKENFIQKFDVKGSSSLVAIKAKNDLLKAVDYIKGQADKIKERNDNIAIFGLKVSEIKDKADELLSIPDKLAKDLEDAIAVFEKATGIDIEDNLFPFLFGDTTNVSTLSTAKAETNTIALSEFMLGQTIANASIIAVDRDYSNINQAEKERNIIINATSQLSETVSDDDLFQILEDLSISISQAVPNNENLPSLVTFELEENKTSLELAFEYHDDLNREQEIIDGNDIENPAMIRKGELIEVLNV